jgi:hypothetical protein
MYNDNMDEQALSPALREAVELAVSTTLTRLGIDCNQPFELQKDMSFLRECRQSAKSVKSKFALLLVGAIFTGITFLMLNGFHVWAMK